MYYVFWSLFVLMVLFGLGYFIYHSFKSRPTKAEIKKYKIKRCKEGISNEEQEFDIEL